MNKDFAAAMRRAALTARAKITNTTSVIQKVLGRSLTHTPSNTTFSDMASLEPKLRSALRVLDLKPQTAQPPAAPKPEPATGVDGVATFPSQRLRKPLGEVLRALREGRLRIDSTDALTGLSLPGVVRSSPLPIAPGAQFLTRSIVCAAGTRSYKLYIPASCSDPPQGLLVMLHGCKQDPDDFAAGTNMNTVAESHGLIIAYPKQTSSANVSSCWNWFNPADQMRNAGEPSIIAAITREIISEFGLNRQQVFVAGLSAGGAMAAVMGETYPDLYAAVGIHSGLAYRSANDVVSAFAAMRGDPNLTTAQPGAAARTEPRVRTIVFHGSADHIVAPSNADRIVASASQNIASARQLDSGRATCGRSFTRTIIAGANGEPIVECWLIDGTPHAWSGGHPSGSYTDPQGPDASAEMVRFFLNRPRK